MKYEHYLGNRYQKLLCRYHSSRITACIIMFLKSIKVGLSSDICHVPTIPKFNSSLIASIILNAVSLSLIQQRINKIK